MTTAVGTTPQSPPRPPAAARPARANRRPGLGHQGPAAARAGLPDRRHPTAVRGDPGDLPLRLELPQPGQARTSPGSTNYASVFTDAALRDSVLTTILLTATVVIASVVLGLALALLLDRTFFGRGMVRTLLITPFLIVPVSAALLWKHALYNPEYGLLNGALSWFGDLFGDRRPRPAGLDRGHAAARRRRRAGLAVDAVHDADPAGRAPEPARRDRSRRPASTARAPGRSSAT